MFLDSNSFHFLSHHKTNLFSFHTLSHHFFLTASISIHVFPNQSLLASRFKIESISPMDYCNEKIINDIWSNVNTDGIEEVKESFSTWSIISLTLCSFSILITILSLKYSSSRSSKRNFERPSRSLYLIINLLITNCLASIVCGLGILFIKFLPIHLDIIVGDCLLLVLEIFQISSLLASGIHHLFLSINQRNAINSLTNYNSNIKKSYGHDSIYDGPDPYFVSILSWILPAFFFSGYFWVIPCQGKSHS